MVIKINFEKCCWKNNSCISCACGGACVGCVEVCPVGALTRKDKLELDKEKCISCGVCIEACKHGALELE